MLSWQLLITLNLLLYSVCVLLQRVLMKEQASRPIAFGILFQSITGLLLLGAGFLFSPMTLPPLVPLSGNLIAMVLLYGFANIFLFQALKRTEASIFTILFATRALFTVAASSMLLRESLTPLQMGGAFCIFLAIVVIHAKKNRTTFGKGEWYSLAAAACFGLANTNDRYLLQSFDVYPYMAIAFLLPAVGMAFVYYKELPYLRLFFKRSVWPKMLLLCSIYALSSFAFFGAFKVGTNASQLAMINLSSVILIVVLSVIFLKERSNMLKKFVAAGLCFVGLVLIS